MRDEARRIPPARGAVSWHDDDRGDRGAAFLQKWHANTLGLHAASDESGKEDRSVRVASRLLGERRQRERLPLWASVISTLAAVKVGAALSVFVTAGVAGARFPATIYLIHVLAFGLPAAVVAVGNHRDRRVTTLAAFFLLIAASFSDPFLAASPRGSVFNPLARTVETIAVDAFLPALLWLFVRDFPQAAAFTKPQRLIETAILGSVLAGFLLLASNALAGVEPRLLATPLAIFDRHVPGSSWYWPVVVSLLMPALPIACWKARLTGPDDRARLRVFLAGLLAGVGPLLVVILLGAPASAAHDWVYLHRTGIGVLAYAGLLSIPVTTGYAIAVHHVLDLQVIIRKSLEYRVVQYALLSVAVAPFVGIAGYVYLQREETIAGLVASTNPVLLGGLFVLGLVLLGARARIMGNVDRLFLREHVDARLVARFSQLARSALDVREVASLLLQHIEEAFHPTTMAVLLAADDDRTWVPVVGTGRPLGRGSALDAILAECPEPLETRLDGPRRRLVHLLPVSEREWLADTQTALLVPLVRSDGALLGHMALGEKRSETSYCSDDRNLLKAVGASASVILEGLEVRRIVSEGAPLSLIASEFTDRPATECSACHNVSGSNHGHCVCGGCLVDARLPEVLLGKFRVERRVGAGGMGVVYRAVDLALGRTVALKTLPRISWSAATRLRGEARAMAAVRHPNLALIFGLETWRHTPVLVVEYVERGTLADRLRDGPLSVRRALDLGIVMSSVLHTAHSAGVLHRDVKPSNIGYAADDTPKLLDFGLATFLLEGDADTPDLHDTAFGSSSSWGVISIDSVRGPVPVAGTPLYLSPEALAGRADDPSADVWSLTLVIFEAIAGSNPLLGSTLCRTLDNIARARIPDVRDLRPDCPAAVAELLGRGLAPDRRRRPASAAAFQRDLLDVRRVLAA